MSIEELKRALYEALKTVPAKTLSEVDFELFIALEREFEV